MKKTLLKILILCMVICFALCVFTACDDTSSGSGDSSYNNTYYLYKNSKYDETNYIKLDSGKFERLQTTAGVAMPKIFGTYTVTDGTIKFYATEDGETANVYNGTIKEGVLTLEKSTFNPTVQTFCAKGYTPSGKIDSGNNQDSDGDNTQQTLYYTVTFNSNGGSNILSQSIVENGYATKPTNPTKSGYTFVGWYSNSALTTSWNFNTNKVTVNITLYAKWQEEIKYYTVTVNRNDNSYGTVSPSSIANVPYGSAITVYGNKLTVNGTTVTATPTTDTAQYSYAFKDWTYSSTVTGSTTITANFTREIKEYSVTINRNDNSYGTVNASSIANVPYGSTITVNGNKLTVNGTTVTATPTTDTAQYSYVFSNWTYSTTVTGATTVIANFTRETRKYTVTLTRNDSSYGTLNTYSLSEIPYGTNIYSSGNKLYVGSNSITATAGSSTEQYSYYLSDWNIPNSTVTGDMTITANFARETRKYSVTINSNDNSYGIVSASSIADVPYGSTITVNGNKLTVNGTTVTATPTASTAQYSYAFSNWTYSSTVTGATMITANFTRETKKYTVTLTQNNSSYGTLSTYSLSDIAYGTSIYSSGNKLYVGSNSITATATSSTAQYSYSLSGWDIPNSTVQENVTVTANFTRNTKNYTVTINRNDNSYGTVSPSSIANIPYGSAITVYGNKLTVNGTTVTATPTTDTAQYSYAFSNWTYSTTVTGATTVTANFTRTVNNYNVNINVINPEYGQITATTLNGINYGTNISHNGNVLTVGGNTVTATPNSDTDNYSYSVNWSHDLTTSENTNITVTFTRTVNQYAVTFYNDDGTTVLGTSTVDYGTAATYPNSAPTKDTTAQYSYAFDKWVTEQDGEVEDNLTNVVVNRNVYAKYTAMPRVYNVYYNENGGTAIADTTYTYGVGLILPTKADISFTGYSFLGWYDSNNNLVTEILASSTGDITLNANWTPFALQNITYNTEKTAIKVTDTINAALFDVTCYDTDGNLAEITVNSVTGTQTAGNTVTIVYKATSGTKSKIITIKDIKVCANPTLDYDSTVSYVNLNDGLTAGWFNASGKDSFGNDTIINVKIDGDYVAGGTVTVIIESLDPAGNVNTAYIENVKAYGLPVINYTESKAEISINDTINAALFNATAQDSFSQNVIVSVSVHSGTVAIGNTVTIRLSATDSKGNTTIIDKQIKVYGMPTISDATKTEFKLTDEITVDSLCVTAKDTYNNALNIILSVKSGEQIAGETMVFTATVTDITGNVTAKEITVKIYGAPSLTYDCEALKEIDNPIKSYTLSFDLNDGSGIIDIQTITNTKGMKYPDIPIKSGYAFSGWYTTPDCLELFDFSRTLSENITLYAGWLKMETKGVYSQYIDARKYNHDSTPYSTHQFYNDSSISSKAFYFTALETNNYAVFFRGVYSSAASNSSVSYYVYNVTKGCCISSYNTILWNKDYTCISMFNADAGDVIYLKTASWQNRDALNMKVYFYIDGANTPVDGGTVDSVLDEVSNDSFGIDLDVNIILKSGELKGGEYVVYTLTATDHLGNTTTVDTAPIPVYSADDIDIHYNEYISNRIRLDSKGEEFIAYATDSFGDRCIISIEAAEGYTLTAGQTISIYLVATDIAGNTAKSKIMNGIQIYGTPSITYNQTLTGIKEETTVADFINLATARDSFGEELYVEYEIIGELVAGNTVRVKVTATDELDNTVIEYIENVKVYGMPTLSYSCEILKDTQNPLIDSSVLNIVAKDTWNHDLTATVTLKSGTFAAGNNVIYTIIVTDKFGHSRTIDTTAIPVYGTPTITNATKTNFKLTGDITPATIGVNGYDSFGTALTVNQTLKSGTRTAGTTMVYTEIVTDIAGNTYSKDITVKIYGTPTVAKNTGYLIPASVDLNSLFTFTDSFGDEIITTVHSVESEYVLWQEITVYFTATDAAGNYISNDYKYMIKDSNYQEEYSGSDIILKAYVGTETDIIIPSIFNKIKTNAFKDNVTLETVTVHKDLTEIGDYAFSGCTSLKGIIIDANNTNFATENGILYNKTKTSIIYVPRGIIGTLTLPSTLTAINGDAFTDCVNLEGIVIPNSVMSIAQGAFANCTSLKTVTIGSGVTSIGQGAFNGCGVLQSIVIPFVGGSKTATTASASTLFGYIFGTTNFGGGVAVNQFYSDTASVTYYIPQTLKTVEVLSGHLLYGAFSNCIYLESIQLNSQVTAVEKFAFKNVSASVVFNRHTTTIGDYSFSEYAGASITLPTNITSIGNYAFYNAQNITAITIPANVVSIGNYAFVGCENLATLNLYNSGSKLQTIGGHTFYGLSKIKTLRVPAVLTIGDYAFAGCSGITSLTFDSSYVSQESVIGKHAFDGCSGVTSLSIAPNIVTIDDYAFANCTGLTSLAFLSSSNYGCKTAVIGNYAFYNCVNLGYGSLPATITSIGSSAFENCTSLSTFTMTSNMSVTEIKARTFYNCERLISVVIASSVTKICDSAFYGCAYLTKFTVGADVKTIESNAFTNCYRLVEILNNSTLMFTVGATTYGGIAYYALRVYTNGGSYVFTDVYSAGTYFYYDDGGDSVLLLGFLPKAGTTRISVTAPPDTFNGKPYAINRYAFFGETRLTDFRVSNNVTAIGAYAFKDCTCEILWGTNPTLTTIESYAFSGYKGTNFVVPDSVTSIGNSAFYNCSGLTSITIGNSVTSIGDNAFSGCSSVTSIYYKGTASEWASIDGLYTLKDLSSTLYINNEPLTNVALEDITRIKPYAFYGCSSLTSITIGNSVTSIGSGAFSGCPIENATINTQAITYIPKGQLKTVTITGGNSIGSYAFYNCSSLTSVTIGNSVTSIGDSAFSGCSSLTSISIPFVGQNVAATSASSSTLFGSIFETRTYGGTGGVIQCYSSTSYVYSYIPTSLKSVTVTGGNIFYGAFYNCSNLTNITIGDGVTSIGECAFFGCSSLEYYQENGALYLGNKYNKCVCLVKAVNFSITSCIINNNCKFVCYGAFSGCSSIESIAIPFVGGCEKTASDTYQYPFGYIFGTSSYTGGTAIRQSYYGSTTSPLTNTTYYIPSSLKKVTVTGGNIISGAFYNCSNLTSVIIGNSVTSIGKDAFYGCSNLSYNEYENGLYLGNNDNRYLVLVKAKSNDITSFTINNETRVVLDAFYNCSSLTNIIIPDSVNYIGDHAFDGCRSLTTVTIPDGVTRIGSHAFDGCRSLTTVTIPDDVASIGSYAFYGCRSLTTVTIPDGVTSIGSYAFYGCSGLTNMTIPNSVTGIGKGAFGDCSKLISVIFNRTQGWRFYVVTSDGTFSNYDEGWMHDPNLSDSLSSKSNAAYYLTRYQSDKYWLRGYGYYTEGLNIWLDK